MIFKEVKKQMKEMNIGDYVTIMIHCSKERCTGQGFIMEVTSVENESGQYIIKLKFQENDDLKKSSLKYMKNGVMVSLYDEVQKKYKDTDMIVKPKTWLVDVIRTFTKEQLEIYKLENIGGIRNIAKAASLMSQHEAIEYMKLHVIETYGDDCIPEYSNDNSDEYDEDDELENEIGKISRNRFKRG